MKTTSDEHRSTGRLALGLLLAVAVMAVPGSASAAPPAKAGIVFVSGGRILSVKADGSGRKVIFGAGRNPQNDGVGASDPEVSPDGSTIVFSLGRSTASGEIEDVWRVGADGSGPRPLLRSTVKRRYLDPTFAPDGRIVVSFFRGPRRNAHSGLISIGAGGGSRKVLMTFPKSRSRWYQDIALEPAVSPDGSRVLYRRSVGYLDGYLDQDSGGRMEILSLGTGRSRKLTEGAYGGAWSPDGRRILYSAQILGGARHQRTLEVCWMDDDCGNAGRLMVMRADGTGAHAVTGARFDERNPDWSRDGRIVLQSARSRPEVGETTELYSVLPDGKCLTWLTNGSPASVAPAWDESTGTDTAPIACGASPGEPVVEIGLSAHGPNRKADLWLGPRFGSLLLSRASRDDLGWAYRYYDCAYGSAARCGAPTLIWNANVCGIAGQLAAGIGGVRFVQRQRGVPVIRTSGGEMGPVTFLFAGSRFLFVLGGSGRGKDRARKEIEALRRLDETAPSAKLPTPLLPASDIRLMRKVKRTFKATGSVRVTARRLGKGSGAVRANLRLVRTLRSFGEYRTVACSRAKTRLGTRVAAARTALPLAGPSGR